MERRPPRGAPTSTPASMPAVTIHSSNAWLRFRETAEFARQTNSRLRIGPVRTRAGAIGNSHLASYTDRVPDRPCRAARAESVPLYLFAEADEKSVEQGQTSRNVWATPGEKRNPPPSRNAPPALVGGTIRR